jgi:hypothetical protein
MTTGMRIPKIIERILWSEKWLKMVVPPIG